MEKNHEAEGHEEISSHTEAPHEAQEAHEAIGGEQNNDHVGEDEDHVGEGEDHVGESEDHEVEAEDVEAETPTSRTLQLGGQEFENARAVSGYLSKSLQTAVIDERLPEEKAHVVLDLLEKHHPKAQEKIAAGLAGVVVRLHPLHATRCFFVVRKDGTEEDFSFRKCLDNIATGKRYTIVFVLAVVFQMSFFVFSFFDLAVIEKEEGFHCEQDCFIVSKNLLAWGFLFVFVSCFCG